MDNILEILVPLIFAAIYFFGNMVTGKSKDDEDAPSQLPRRRNPDEIDPEIVERQRRIQEEIRRKIMERRQAGSESGVPAAGLGELRREPAQEVRAKREESGQTRKETRERVHENRSSPPPLVSGKPSGSEPEPLRPVFSWDESDDAYASSMEAQLKQIEATKRQAEQLKREAVSKRKSMEGSTGQKVGSGRRFTGTVRDSLRNPEAARAAFIYGEVLGQPVALRKGAGTVPGLS